METAQTLLRQLHIYPREYTLINIIIPAALRIEASLNLVLGWEYEADFLG